MTLAVRLAALLAAVGTAACGSAPGARQVTLHVETDAPIPPNPAAAPDPLAPPALFDRLSVEVFLPGDATAPCAGCYREFAIDAARLTSGAASVGIVPEDSRPGYRVRVRLFHRELVQGGQPLPRTTLEAVVELPALAADDSLEGLVTLLTDDVGAPHGSLSSPEPLAQGGPGHTRAGSWPGAQRVPCDRPPEDGEVCVPGGAFWMGHPLVPGGVQRDDAPAPRLVVLSPYFLDRQEVTASALLAAGTSPSGTDPPDPAVQAPGTGFDAFCTLPPTPDGAAPELRPVNCVSYERALRHCAERSPLHPEATLPTEAQLEYAAGGAASLPFPWGADRPACEDAVFARGGGTDRVERYPSYCRPLGGRGGVALAGSGRRDALGLDGETVDDLAGNLAELALDDWEPQQGPCWRPSLLHDPRCQTGEAAPVRVVRAGSWGGDALDLRAAYRAAAPIRFAPQYPVDTHLGPFVGFRCARPAAPLPPNP